MLLNDEKSVLSRAVGCRAAAALVSRRVVDAACVLDGLSVTELVLFLLLPQDEGRDCDADCSLAFTKKSCSFGERSTDLSKKLIGSTALRCRMTHLELAYCTHGTAHWNTSTV